MLSSEDIFCDGEDEEDILGLEFIDGPSRIWHGITTLTRKSVCIILCNTVNQII